MVSEVLIVYVSSAACTSNALTCSEVSIRVTQRNILKTLLPLFRYATHTPTKAPAMRINNMLQNHILLLSPVAGDMLVLGTKTTVKVAVSPYPLSSGTVSDTSPSASYPLGMTHSTDTSSTAQLFVFFAVTDTVISSSESYFCLSVFNVISTPSCVCVAAHTGITVVTHSTKTRNIISFFLNFFIV